MKSALLTKHVKFDSPCQWTCGLNVEREQLNSHAPITGGASGIQDNINIIWIEATFEASRYDMISTQLSFALTAETKRKASRL